MTKKELKIEREYILNMLELLYQMRTTSEVLSNNIKTLLSEESYSFGFRPVDDLFDNIVDMLDDKYHKLGPDMSDTALFDYYTRETNFGKSYFSDKKDEVTAIITVDGDIYELSSNERFVDVLFKFTYNLPCDPDTNTET
jgi:hypothetical protein